MAINFGKKDFLKMLRDVEVRKEIKNIVEAIFEQENVIMKSSRENRDGVENVELWKNKYSVPKQEFDNQIKQAEEKGYLRGFDEGKKQSEKEWEKKYKEVCDKYNELKDNELKRIQKEVEDLKAKLESRFEDVAKVYEVYENNEEMKRALKGFFPQKGFESFAVTLSQENSIENIWGKCKDNRSNQKLLSELWNLFLCAIKLVNLSKGSQFKYSVLNPKIGEKFDEDEHVGIGRSKAQGKISKVILCGYKQGKSTIQKSNVEVQ